MPYYYTDVFQTLEYWGLSDVLVPFILVFTVVFAILQKIGILPEKRFNVIVALALALGVIIPHVTYMYPADADVVNIINQSLPSIAVIVVGVMMALLLIGSFGWTFVGGAVFPSVIAIAAFVIVLFIFGRSAGWYQYGFLDWLDLYISPETWSLFVVLLIFGGIVYFIVRKEPGAGEGMGDTAKKVIKDIFGGLVK